MEESRARRVVAALRERGVMAHVERPGVYAAGVAVQLRDGRRAVWGVDSELSATVERNGVLVGFVPALPRELDDDALVEAIAAADYDAPPEPVRPSAAPRPVRRGLLGRVVR